MFGKFRISKQQAGTLPTSVQVQYNYASAELVAIILQTDLTDIDSLKLQFV